MLSLIVPLSAHAINIGDRYHRYEYNYKNRLDSSKTTELVQTLKSYKVIIVPGVVSQSFMSYSKQSIKFTLLFEDIFQDQLNWLEKNNIDHEMIKLESEESVSNNAEKIANHIKRSKKPVILIAHSKGGVDTLHALMENPDILDKIKTFTAIQSPFYGTSIAEVFKSNPFLGHVSKELFKYLGGQGAGFDALTLSNRKVYMEIPGNIKKIATVSKKVNIINFSSIKVNSQGWDTTLEIFRDATQETEGDNDGVVAQTSAHLNTPEVKHIYTQGVDHLLTVTKCRELLSSWNIGENENTKCDYDRVSHFKALLELSIE